MKTALLLLTLLSTMALAQQKGSFTDTRDKKTYKTVKIGELTWMAENLNFVTKDSKCYDNKDANCKKYGRLYNGKTSETICPTGWRLPTGEEWETLPKADNHKALKSKSGWNDDYNDDGEKISGNGDDKFGFSALPGGLYGFDDGPGEEHFLSAGRCGFWNSTTSYYTICSGTAGFMGLSYWEYDEDNFLSVRCIQGEAQAPPIKSVKIGNQVWMAENLNDASKGGKCHDDKPENCEKYGRLYTWEEAKKACPSGWHLPSDAEWTTLTKFAGGDEIAGGKLKAKSGWSNGGNGTNDYGFSLTPDADNEYSRLWTSTESNAKNAWRRRMDYDNAKVLRDNQPKVIPYSVRCVKD